MSNQIISLIRFLVIIAILLFFANFCYSQYKYDFRVNDDATTKYQNAAKLDVDKDGNFIVVWQDKRNIITLNPIYDIYCQRFNYKGEPQGNNFKVNLHDSAASNPNIALRKDGSFIIGWKEGVWIGSYIYQSRYYIRIYDKFGLPTSNYIPVSDSAFNLAASAPPAIGIDNFNNIYVAMVMILGQYGEHHLYFQKLDSLGNKIGTNELVIDASVTQIQNYPDITIRNDGSFIIAWDDMRLGSGDIFMQKYNTIGQKIGTNIKVNDDPVDPNIGHWSPSVSTDSSKNVTIVWVDSRQSSGSFQDIYCQNIDSAFNFIGSNFRVNQGSIWERGNGIVKKRSDGYFVVGWNDYWANGANFCPYLRRFSNINQFIGNQHWVTNYNPSQAKAFCDLTFWEDRIISIWGDYRNGNCDIYCNIRSFQNPDSIINSISISNKNYSINNTLFQNYPNPFNPVTKINFELPKDGNVKLVIYDILGREIKSLVNEFKHAGKYIVEFNGNSLASGIYFYRIQAGNFVQVKKMVLIK